MARINVSVPDSLRERMSALDREVNWSEIAQAAFEREVSARTFKGENMEQVIERLRVSKGQYLQAQQGQGRKDGINWARLFANYAELKALSQFEPEGENLASQFDSVLGNDQKEGESFWINEDTGRYDPPSDEYVEAYVEGVKSVWDEVEDKL